MTSDGGVLLALTVVSFVLLTSILWTLKGSRQELQYRSRKRWIMPTAGEWVVLATVILGTVSLIVLVERRVANELALRGWIIIVLVVVAWFFRRAEDR